MDPRFFAQRDELHNVQMELRQVKNAQDHHAERLLRLEKRQQEDAALKSVWSSPFPTALGGTPQHGPTHLPAAEDFDLAADVPTHALGSLHLEPDDEPARRGAASRANSVRFDESANWGANTRHSGDFGLSRPSSGLAMMERSLSHKSDGRHSSAGQSVHSVHSVHSTHSVASGRGSSLALDTFMGREEDSPIEIPDPPPSSFYLEPAPALVRCWLTNDFVSNSVLYAAVCSGAQKSLLEHSLIQELGLTDQVFRDVDGVYRISLSVYLTEAMVAQASSRSPNPVPQMPSLTARFEVIGLKQGGGEESPKRIRIFLGSDVLRTHNVDLLFSQNLMMLYTSNREKLTVPFARPDDESLFRNLATAVVPPEKPKLNAAAAEFVSTEPKSQDAAEVTEAPEITDTAKPHPIANNDNAAVAEKPVAPALEDDVESLGPLSPTTDHATQTSNWVKSTQAQAQAQARASENGDLDKAPRESISSDHSAKEGGPTDAGARRDSSAIWGSWRQGGPSSGDRENGLSGYRPAGQGRTMKVLKTAKSSTSSLVNREPAPAPRTSGELRRKSQAHGAENGTGSSSSRVIHWERKNGNNAVANGSVSGGLGSKESTKTTPGNQDTTRNVSNPFPRSANPVGGASAFAWMKPEKPKAATTGAN